MRLLEARAFLSFFLFFEKEKKNREREGGVTQGSAPAKPPGRSGELRKATPAPRIGTKGGRGPEPHGVEGRGMPCAASHAAGGAFCCRLWSGIFPVPDGKTYGDAASRRHVDLPREGTLYGGAFLWDTGFGLGLKRALHCAINKEKKKKKNKNNRKAPSHGQANCRQ